MSQIQQKVVEQLNEKGFSYEIVQHPAVYTIEEMEQLHIDGGEVAKNLFLRDDKKKRYFLVMLQKDKRVNLEELRIKLGSRRLGFASEADLYRYMGLTRGAVSPFGTLNDADCLVEVVVDQDLATFKRIGVHPNENTATVWIGLEDIEAVIRAHGNEVLRICL